MVDLEPPILDLLREHEVADPARRLEELDREEELRRRELAEVREGIPLWDRILFFQVTDEEAREEELETRLEEIAAERAELEGTVEDALAAAAEAHPPFAVGRAAEEAVRALREADGPEDGIESPLEEALGIVVETWVPGLELEEMVRRLGDPDACREVAAPSAPSPGPGEPGPAGPDDRLGIAPMDPSDLEPLAARRILDGPYLDRLERHRELAARSEETAELAEEAAEAVGLWDRIWVFSDSEAEQAAERAELRMTEAQDVARSAHEEARQALRDALGVHPPLRVALRLLEALGICRLMEVGEERTFGPEGIVERTVLVPRPLAFSALERLVETLDEVFPGLPLPSEALRALAGEAKEPEDDEAKERPRPPAASVFRPILDGLEDGEGPWIRQEAMRHALLAGAVDRAVEDVRAGISWLDRAAFWSDTDEEAREERLERRLDWNRDWLGDRWNELLSTIRSVAGGQPVYRVRDALLRAHPLIRAIHTDPGTSSTPRSCSVYGKSEALAALGIAKATIEETYGLRPLREMIRQVALAEPRAGDLEAEGPAPCREVSAGELACVLAARLEGSGLQERQIRISELEREVEERASEEDEIGDRVSLWDTINVFSTTEDEAALDDVRAELADLRDELAAEVDAARNLLLDALVDYPPAGPYFALQGVIGAVRAIYAVSVRHTRQVGSGDNKRTETYYTCEIRGRARALSAMAKCGAAFHAAFGDLPTYHELLERWELRGSPLRAIRGLEAEA